MCEVEAAQRPDQGGRCRGLKGAPEGRVTRPWSREPCPEFQGGRELRPRARSVGPGRLQGQSRDAAGLEELLGGTVWLARASSSDREFIEDLLHPVKVLALGTVWLPDGTKLAKAIGRRQDGRRSHSLELVKRIAKEVRGVDVVVESDRGRAGRTNIPRIERLATATWATPDLPSDNDGPGPARSMPQPQTHRRSPPSTPIRSLSLAISRSNADQGGDRACEKEPEENVSG